MFKRENRKVLASILLVMFGVAMFVVSKDLIEEFNKTDMYILMIDSVFLGYWGRELLGELE